MLANILSRYWWMTLVRGVLWILFGLFVFAQPGISLLTLTLTFGIFALADGVGSIVSAVAGRDQHDHWWMLLLAGIAGVLVGLVTFISPRTAAVVLLLYIALWALATGFLQIVAAVRLRKEIQGEFWLAFSGVLTIVFGMLLILRPAAGALSVLWLIAAYAVAFGVFLIGLAFRMRAFGGRVNAGLRM